MSNIHYKTTEIANFFSTNRIRWEQFYESEKKLIERLDLKGCESILDIGCGCGGLGMALKERFAISRYIGVDINSTAIKKGRELDAEMELIIGDFLSLSESTFQEKEFDSVFSLSCIDWNVEFTNMLLAAWNHVAPGGKFIATFRLTDAEGINNFDESYQYINYEGKKEGELASYVVLNLKELMTDLINFKPSKIMANGYWGPPSKTAVTPFSELCFAAFSIEKRKEKDESPIEFALDLPLNILEKISPIL